MLPAPYTTEEAMLLVHGHADEELSTRTRRRRAEYLNSNMVVLKFLHQLGHMAYSGRRILG